MGVNRLIKNTLALSVLQIFNYIAPLLLIPYLTRVLNVDEFGSVMVALSTVTISFVITDYGFSLSANYRISQNRHDEIFINKLIAKIFSAKLILLPIALVLLIAISLLPAFFDYKHIFWAGSISIITQAYQPHWLFQGLERMKSYVVYMALTKVLYAAIALVFVHKAGDGVWVLTIWSISNSLGLIIALYMLRRMGYLISFSSWAEAIIELKESSQYFWSRVAVALYTSGSSIIVGTAGLHQAALFSAAYKGFQGVQAITGSITQAIYPYMTKEKDWQLFFKILSICTIILLFSAIIVGYFAEFFIGLIFGIGYEDAAPVLVVMMVTLVINYLGVSFGYPALGALNRIEVANKSVIWASLAFCLFSTMLLFIGRLNAINVAWLILITESIVFISRLFSAIGPLIKGTKKT